MSLSRKAILDSTEKGNIINTVQTAYLKLGFEICQRLENANEDTASVLQPC